MLRGVRMSRPDDAGRGSKPDEWEGDEPSEPAPDPRSGVDGNCDGGTSHSSDGPDETDTVRFVAFFRPGM